MLHLLLSPQVLTVASSEMNAGNIAAIQFHAKKEIINYISSLQFS